MLNESAVYMSNRNHALFVYFILICCITLVLVAKVDNEMKREGSVAGKEEIDRIRYLDPSPEPQPDFCPLVQHWVCKITVSDPDFLRLRQKCCYK